MATADESKALNVAAMGAELGTVYSELWQEVAWIHSRWAQFVELFGTSPKRIEIMNEGAPGMFRVLQDTLFEAVLLHIGRLTDPAKSAGRDNLSLQRLAQLTASSPVGDEVQQLTQAAVASSQFARDWRNRKLAHRDLDLALGQAATALAPASRQSVKETLAAIANVLNAVSHHYLDSTTAFNIRLGAEQALLLLQTVRDGTRSRNERFDRLQRGEYRPEEWQDEQI